MLVHRRRRWTNIKTALDERGIADKFGEENTMAWI